MKTINILLLDDKEENIISLSALLEDVDHVNLISSTDPNDALKICWKEDISIALVDVQMPKINGFEFVSILKSNPKTSHIMAIMVTAISKEDKYLLQGLESGARSEEHTSELQSRENLVCRLLLEKKKLTIQESCIWKSN